ncbi:MAG: hypothetical protein J7K26_03735 [Candidatus Aenigmarchaeota archaeon]|nr:hypothetical protein [Candidatus Aenigmarchaeota archaeon]
MVRRGLSEDEYTKWKKEKATEYQKRLAKIEETCPVASGDRTLSIDCNRVSSGLYQIIRESESENPSFEVPEKDKKDIEDMLLKCANNRGGCEKYCGSFCFKLQRLLDRNNVPYKKK